jgi:hypothetical protein
VLTRIFWQMCVARMCAQEDSDVWIGLQCGVSGQLLLPVVVCEGLLALEILKLNLQFLVHLW